VPVVHGVGCERSAVCILSHPQLWKGRLDPVLHIELRRWADLMLVAPLDANTLAKLANGICDNLLVSNWSSAWPELAHLPALGCLTFLSWKLLCFCSVDSSEICMFCSHFTCLSLPPVRFPCSFSSSCSFLPWPPSLSTPRLCQSLPLFPSPCFVPFLRFLMGDISLFLPPPSLCYACTHARVRVHACTHF